MRLTKAAAKAIRFSCLNFRYAKSVPSVQYAYNVYNDSDEWCGCICFGGGAAMNIAAPFGMIQGQVLELVRVALNGKQNATSQCVAAAIKQLHKDDPLVKLIVSYADLDQNHAGTIYQATNWIYLGKMNEGSRSAFIINGRKTHPRTIGSSGGVQSLKWVQDHIDKNATLFYTKGKHKYIFVFEKRLRKEWQKKALPYPKKEVTPNAER